MGATPTIRRRTGRLALCSFTGSLLLALPACSRQSPPGPNTPQPASQSAPNPPPTPPEPPAVIPASHDWSKAEALEKIANAAADAPTRLSAAVRLVRLSSERPLCLPDPLPDELARHLRVLSLGKQGWALGLARDKRPRQVRSPVLIAPDGAVALPADGAEEEVAVLHASSRPESFPHLVITPQRVLLVADKPKPALLARSLGPLRFDVRRREKFVYLALVLPQAAAAPQDSGGASGDAGQTDVVVAEYRWDVYEETFSGPAADRLPPPHTGRFELDLNASPALLPIGGEMAASQPNVRPAPRPGPDDGPDY